MSNVDVDKLRNYLIILYPENQDDMKRLDYIVENYHQFAYIKHDKDIDVDTGEIKKSHIHCLIKFKSVKSINMLAKELDIEKHRIEYVRNLFGAIRYLIHFDNPEKYQYSKYDITSNFNLDRYFLNRKDELTEARLILNLIQKYNITSVHILIEKCIEYNVWAVFRRSSYIWIRLLDEIKEVKKRYERN